MQRPQDKQRLCVGQSPGTTYVVSPVAPWIWLRCCSASPASAIAASAAPAAAPAAAAAMMSAVSAATADDCCCLLRLLLLPASDISLWVVTPCLGVLLLLLLLEREVGGLGRGLPRPPALLPLPLPLPLVVLVAMLLPPALLLLALLPGFTGCDIGLLLASPVPELRPDPDPADTRVLSAGTVAAAAAAAAALPLAAALLPAFLGLLLASTAPDLCPDPILLDVDEVTSVLSAGAATAAATAVAAPAATEPLAAPVTAAAAAAGEGASPAPLICCCCSNGSEPDRRGCRDMLVPMTPAATIPGEAERVSWEREGLAFRRGLEARAGLSCPAWLKARRVSESWFMRLAMLARLPVSEGRDLVVYKKGGEVHANHAAGTEGSVSCAGWSCRAVLSRLVVGA